MRKVLAVFVILVLGLAILIELGLSTEPAIRADATTAVASSSELASLGPIELIAHEYEASTVATCTLGTFSDSFAIIFTAGDLGIPGTITSAHGIFGGHTVSEAGGSVTVSGIIPKGLCGTAALVEKVLGDLGSGDEFIVNIVV